MQRRVIRGRKQTFPWANEFDFRYEANNTQPVQSCDIRLHNRDHYITIVGYTDTNVSIVAYASRGLVAAPTRPGEFGIEETENLLCLWLK